MPPLLCAALSVLLIPRPAWPALPPASFGDSSTSTRDATSGRDPAPAKSERGRSGKAVQGQQGEEGEGGWTVPRVQLGGRLSYDIRSISHEGQRNVQRGLITTVTAATSTYIWEPWFAPVGGNLTVSGARNGSSNESDTMVTSSQSNSLAVSGSAQMRILPFSKFPFEAHFDRADNRFSTELLPVGQYTSQRYGFSQRFMREAGDVMAAWDRATQDSDSSGKTQQDTLQLSLTHNLEDHSFQVTANRSDNRQLTNGDSYTDTNVSIHHNYLASDTVTVDTTVNTTRSNFQIGESDTSTKLAQLSTVLFWRPEEVPLTVTGSARVLGLAADYASAAATGAEAERKLRSSSLSLGMSYSLTEHTTMNASAMMNTTSSEDTRTVNSGQSAGILYQPDEIELGDFHYRWSAGASANNAVSGGQRNSQLSLQISHNLNRNFQLDEGSSIAVDASQSLSNRFGDAGQTIGLEATRQLTHSGSVSWTRRSTDGSGTAMVRLGISDSRALDGYKDYFQMVNLQVSSNLSTGPTSFWSGSLTVQAYRQGGENPTMMSLDSLSGTNTYNGGFTLTSSGSLSYQNNRMFRIRQLRFVSDLRLTGQALLPVFGGPDSQELAAWDNRFDYAIGRTTFRVAMLIAKASFPLHVRRDSTDTLEVRRETRLNKSIMFSATRAFGD